MESPDQWRLVQRIRAFWEKGSRYFRLWGRVVEAQDRAKQAEHEATSWRLEAKRQQQYVDQLEKRLEKTVTFNPLALAEELLAQADMIFSRNDVHKYELQTWRVEYQAYIYRRRREQ